MYFDWGAFTRFEQPRNCFVYFQKRTEENAQKAYDLGELFLKLSTERKNHTVHGADSSIDLLSKRQQDVINMQTGIGSSNGDNDSNSSEDDGYASSEIRLGSSIAIKSAVCPIILPQVERLPQYTTWVFLDRYVKVPWSTNHAVLKFDLCLYFSLYEIWCSFITSSMACFWTLWMSNHIFLDNL